MPTITRTYALTKLGRGDYLLLSNDAKTLYRIARYEETGSIETQHGPLVGWFWGVWRYNGSVLVMLDLDLDYLSNWDLYTMVESNDTTRARAIQSALRLSTSTT